MPAVTAKAQSAPALAAEYAAGTGLSASDRSALAQAASAARRENWAQVYAYAAVMNDHIAADLCRWLYYTHADRPQSFEDISSFLRHHKNWPQAKAMAGAAESAMDVTLPDSVVLKWFREYKPQTPQGMDRFLQALNRSGARKELTETVNGWWRRAQLSPDQQKYFFETYGNVLARDSHVVRLSWLLNGDQYTAARALARRLGNGYPELTETRVALSDGNGGVDVLLSRVPATLQNDPGLMLERLRWRLRNDKDYAAIEILHNMPPVETLPDPDSWWKARETLIRRLMADRQYESAYYLAAGHGMHEGSSFADAEFMAGWLALRYVNKPWEAFQHFERLYQAVTTPVSRARAAYWAGKASDALKYPDIARQWYVAAARHQTTFYGQMALNTLPEKQRPKAQVSPVVTLAGQQSFEKLDLVRAVRILKDMGLRDETADFISALSDQVKEPQDYRLAAQLAEEIGYYHSAVRVAKKALNQGVLLSDQLYPTMLAQMSRIKTEWALVHALIRQESIFDPQASSPVGALGLMQVMPATAKHVAHKNGFRVPGPAQLYDPALNLKFGTAYLQEMLDKYSGSYPLALAAYNAGPSRVERWLADYGDPRSGRVSLIDWVESIPFSETRNYVQRILESVYVYRLKFRDLQDQVQDDGLHTAAGNGI